MNHSFLYLMVVQALGIYLLLVLKRQSLSTAQKNYLLFTGLNAMLFVDFIMLYPFKYLWLFFQAVLIDRSNYSGDIALYFSIYFTIFLILSLIVMMVVYRVMVTIQKGGRLNHDKIKRLGPQVILLFLLILGTVYLDFSQLFYSSVLQSFVEINLIHIILHFMVLGIIGYYLFQKRKQDNSHFQFTRSWWVMITWFVVMAFYLIFFLAYFMATDKGWLGLATYEWEILIIQVFPLIYCFISLSGFIQSCRLIRVTPLVEA